LIDNKGGGREGGREETFIYLLTPIASPFPSFPTHTQGGKEGGGKEEGKEGAKHGHARLAHLALGKEPFASSSLASSSSSSSSSMMRREGKAPLVPVITHLCSGEGGREGEREGGREGEREGGRER